MSEHPATPDLFARKGHAGADAGSLAKPASPNLFASDGSDPQRNEGETASEGHGAEEAAGPASLRSIKLKRGNALAAALADDKDAGVARNDALSSASKSGDDGVPPAARTAMAHGTGSAHGPYLALLAIACFAVGFWYTVSSSNRTEPDSTANVQPGASVSSARLSDQGREADSGAAPSATTGYQQTARQSDSPQTDTAPSTEAADEPDQLPTFDLIRIEPNGEAVIAGRAAPNSELILLDNGEPMVKVTADWAGEWAFIPTTPLAPGDHEFSLVIVTPQGTVTVPGVGKPEGSSLKPLESGDGAVSKAATQATTEETGQDAQPSAGETVGKTAPYAVQLSSTTSWKGAEQEWLKLQRSFPKLLGDKKLVVHKADLQKRGTWYRVRTGDFPELASARKFCSALRAKRQDCLVIKR